MELLEKFFEVYHFDKKKRYGINEDGGYVIGVLENYKYDCYISAGVSSEESFTRDFLLEHNYLSKENCFAFDGTIDDYPYHYTDNIIFQKKNISSQESENLTNLQELLSNYDKIFIKMDIEGGEFPWILSLPDEILKKISQLVIEFHGLWDDSWETNFENKLKCYEKLFNTHFIIHAHGNNYAPSNKFPHVLEVTYINKDIMNNVEMFYNKSPLPDTELDFPNNKFCSDIDLNFYPFCFPSSQKVLITGFPHCGTSILKSIIGHIDSVDEIFYETTNLNKKTNKKFVCGKWPFYDDQFIYSNEFKDCIKIFIIRNPIWVFSSLNRRFDYNIKDDHSFQKYLEVLNKFIFFRNNSEKNVFTIRYEDIFKNNFEELKKIFDKTGFQYSEEIFDNEKYNNKIVHGFDKYNSNCDDNYKADYGDNYMLRTMQINKPFTNNNFIKNIELSQEQIYQIINNKTILEIFPEINTFVL